MTEATAAHPPFGAADLSNCERELIHLAGSVQPHGVLLVLRDHDLVIIQASVNTESLLGMPHAALLGKPVGILGGNVAEQLGELLRSGLLMLPTPLQCTVAPEDRDDIAQRELHGMLHRQPRSGIVLELEPVGDERSVTEGALPKALASTIGRVTSASNVAELSDEVVRYVRELTGYDRVMIYRFDPDGHGEVIAEARDEKLDPLLGQHYPASDIPQRARDLYLRTRVRVLTDVHYEPQAIAPRHAPHSGEELDMSMCFLRSMSPLHLQYLENMGVTATLVTSLVREGKLWGLIACHHYSPKSVAYEMRAACELLSEVVSTRISALENRAQIEAELFVRELENALVVATTTSGDWRDALFDDPELQLLEPFGASGAALIYDGEVLTAGTTPSLQELRALAAWLAERDRELLFQTSQLPAVNEKFASLSTTATGVLAVEMSRREGEYLMWFRPEQIHTVTWAGNPQKAIVVGNDPRDLSPRRSFAAWSELVRGIAKPWSAGDVATASAVRASLVDVILQTRALRALIAERQATTTLGVIESAAEPMILADGQGDVLIVNDAFHRLLERPLSRLQRLDDLLALSSDTAKMREVLHRVNAECQPWRGELRFTRVGAADIPVAARVDPVPGLHGDVLGYILIFTDLREHREASEIRARLERAIAESHRAAPLGGVAAVMSQDFEKLLSAILANASAAVMQIADGSTEVHAGDLLRELESATRRAADLTAQILSTVSRTERSS
ncbi:MAG: GAF domain-containing protein [Gemmatimonadota bacterium]